MWTRKELKDKAKKSFSINFWKTILVSIILAFILGSAGSSAVGGKVLNGSATENTSTVEDFSEGLTDGFYGDSLTETQQAELDKNLGSFNYTVNSINGVSNFVKTGEIPEDLSPIFVLIGFTIILTVIAIGIVISAFILNPIEVGCMRFFTMNLNRKANVSEVAHAFDNNYMTVAKTMFFRDLYTVLWTLLFIIPGIVKSYEYRMIPYILADHPEMTKDEVFAKSKELMRGQKWNAFVLDLSFIGWGILSVFTIGILGVFYVSPYRNMTNAALYEKLEYGKLAIDEQ